MKKSTFISFIALLILLGIYFLLIDPLLANNRWAAYAVYMLLFAGWHYLAKTLADKAQLDQRFDAQTSVWLVVGSLLFFTVLITAWSP